LEIVLILAQERCTVCTECTIGMEIALGTIVLASAQDRCTVFVECTICLEIILDAPDGTPS
jgi:hypothetical protein